jgi:hypothetical protein
MKTRTGFVSNSSSSSFIIPNSRVNRLSYNRDGSSVKLLIDISEILWKDAGHNVPRIVLGKQMSEADLALWKERHEYVEPDIDYGEMG